MDEFVIGLSGTLEVDKTVDAIKGAMPKVAKQVNSGNNNSLLFVGKLDESKTIAVLQQQLNDISTKLTFTIKSDGLQDVISSLKEVSKVIAQASSSAQANGLEGQIKSVKTLTGEYGDLVQVKKQYDSLFSEKPVAQTSTYQNGYTTTTTTQYTDSQKNDTKVITENLGAQQKALETAALAADKYYRTLKSLSEAIDRPTSKSYLADSAQQAEVLSRIEGVKAEIERLVQTTDKDAFARQKASIDSTISSITTYIFS